MTSDSLDTLLRVFRRQMGRVRLIRLGLFTALSVVILASAFNPEWGNRWLGLSVIVSAMLLWVILAFSSTRRAQLLQSMQVLLGMGRLDEAEAGLKQVMTGLSLSPQIQLLAGQQLATVYALRGAHDKVVAVCRELLRYRLRALRHLVVSVRLLLADSLLKLNCLDDAYAAMVPVYEEDLTLADRMRLLPIQLRYELAADHASSSVQNMSDKVRIAELLDSRQAGLVHAMLAEACRREELWPQHRFLLERARLYCDLETLSDACSLLKPLVAKAAVSPGDEPPDPRTDVAP